jgi:hypothetical protein
LVYPRRCLRERSLSPNRPRANLFEGRFEDDYVREYRRWNSSVGNDNEGYVEDSADRVWRGSPGSTRTTWWPAAITDETPLLPTKRVNVLGSPTEQTPVFAAVMRGPSSASPATGAAATSVLVLALWYVANVVTHHGAAATGMLGPRRLIGHQLGGLGRRSTLSTSAAWQTDGRCMKWRPSDDAQYVFSRSGGRRWRSPSGHPC